MAKHISWSGATGYVCTFDHKSVEVINGKIRRKKAMDMFEQHAKQSFFTIGGRVLEKPCHRI